MEHLLWTGTVLLGPCYGLLLVSLMIARRWFRDTQILFEMSEWMLWFPAASVAFAIAGVIMQFT